MTSGCKWWPAQPAALALLLGGCGVDASAAAPESGEVAAAQSALSSIDKLATVLDADDYTFATNANWTDDGVIFVRRPRTSSDADALGAFYFSNPSLGWLATSGNITAVTQDYPYSSATFLARGSAIYKWGLYGDTKLANASGTVNGELVVDSTKIYWSDAAGLAKANKTGGGFMRICPARTSISRAWKATGCTTGKWTVRGSATYSARLTRPAPSTSSCTSRSTPSALS